MTQLASPAPAVRFAWWKPVLFAVVVIGLLYVKWQPYYGKAFTAAETHFMVYFLDVWKAARRA